MKEKEIADRIKQIRISAGYTQQEIADRLDIHVNTYTGMERGKIPILHKNLLPFAQLCHSSVEEILLGYEPNANACNELREVEAKYSIQKQSDEEMHQLIIREKDQQIHKLEEDIDLLKSLIKEKDARIELLEKLSSEKDLRLGLLEQFGKDYVTLRNETDQSKNISK